MLAFKIPCCISLEKQPGPVVSILECKFSLCLLDSNQNSCSTGAFWGQADSVVKYCHVHLMKRWKKAHAKFQEAMSRASQTTAAYGGWLSKRSVLQWLVNLRTSKRGVRPLPMLPFRALTTRRSPPRDQWRFYTIPRWPSTKI